MKKVLLIALACLSSVVYAQTTDTAVTPAAETAEVNPETAMAGLVQHISAEPAEPAKSKLSIKPDSAFLSLSLKERFFYGYNFDIYYHHDTRSNQKSNGWSFSLTPEFGYKISQKAQVGIRLGGNYSSTRTDYPIVNLEGKEEYRNILVRSGSWEVTPYGRIRLKTMFNDKVGIWLEAHLYTGMEFPSVVEGDAKGTDYDGLRHTITYGAQVSPVITYQFNKKSNFQIFFSILSLGYSGTTFCYTSPEQGHYHEYSNDVIIFSGKLRNLISNQFTPGLYGLKFGVQKNF